jgi:NLR family CARD domain-containing protein 3
VIKQAIIQNPHLSVLRLSYNNLGDNGTAIVSQGFMQNGLHHKSLSVLDMGFNSMKDPGCAALALHAVAGNDALRTLYLSGNNIKQKGAMALAGAILHGCSLNVLYLSANTIGPVGIQALARAVAEREAMRTAEDKAYAEEAANSRSIVVLKRKPAIQTLEELHVSDCAMGPAGFVTIPSMLLTNFSMRVLCLSHNEIDDNDMALLAQAFSRNKEVPLEVLQLSHNSISCTGIECVMNAVWGSKTLREMRFDNNKIRDRGAQLFAVVLTSIALEVIDLSGNKITTVGIKALMKSLSENASLSYLGLCGIPIDANSAKALSYGIAYNSTLKYLYIDKCSVGYAAQRHVVAGIVSNRYAALRVLTGFPIGGKFLGDTFFSSSLSLTRCLINIFSDRGNVGFTSGT